MDAIDQRLAYLESLQNADEFEMRVSDAVDRQILKRRIGTIPLPDPPEFSCQPTGPIMMRAGEKWNFSQADGWRRDVPSEVRERVRERSDHADSAAELPLWGSSEHFQQLVTQHRSVTASRNRYRDSLRALLVITDPSSRDGAYGRIADMHAMIAACLDDGGTITPEGLQHAE